MWAKGIKPSRDEIYNSLQIKTGKFYPSNFRQRHVVILL